MIYYTDHARQRMILRGITREMVQSALLKPDQTGIGYQGKNLVFKKFDKGIIKVVFIKKRTSHTLIVSVIWELIRKN